jgi:hypothetical protein
MPLQNRVLPTGEIVAIPEAALVDERLDRLRTGIPRPPPQGVAEAKLDRAVLSR